jgi:hypothetical protein
MSISFWINQPTILLKKKYILDILPNKNMVFNEKLNAISRLIVLLSMIGYIITSNSMLLLLAGISILSIIGFYYFKTNKNMNLLINKRENFENFENLTKKEIIDADLVVPTDNNPLMNVMLTDIKDNPNRNSAAPSANPDIQEDITKKTINLTKNSFNDNDIDKKLFKDLGDSMNLDMSMRQFYTMPNTRVSNDQKSFAEFCYKDMIKENPLKKDISFKDMKYK